MIDFKNYTIGQTLYFKFSGGVAAFNILRINKNTMTIDTKNSYNKLTKDGIIKGFSNSQALFLIGISEYKEVKYEITTRNEYRDWKGNYNYEDLTTDQMERVLEIVREVK